VTDFADGGDALQTLQAFPQGIPWQQVSRILRQLTEALAYLHERNIAHRDVKSANILFVNGRACLGDVGLAKALTRTRSSHDGTHSIAYAAPEMFRDQVHLKSDVYSLGITTYELLTGQLPFTGSPAAVMFHHLQSEPDLARVQNETAKEVLGRMLQKDPSDRISAAELLAILPST
jgi:serine/threonine protein kinase